MNKTLLAYAVAGAAIAALQFLGTAEQLSPTWRGILTLAAGAATVMLDSVQRSLRKGDA
jgi:hypothetical protein